jgi:hypothetical protein
MKNSATIFLEPLVKPNQAFVVTRILDAIYQSAQRGKEVIFN